jgi:hypothetical protein
MTPKSRPAAHGSAVSAARPTGSARPGFIDLGQDRGHVLHDIIRIVWVVAQRRADIDAFLNRLEELRADLDRAARID